MPWSGFVFRVSRCGLFLVCERRILTGCRLVIWRQGFGVIKKNNIFYSPKPETRNPKPETRNPLGHSIFRFS